MAGSLVTRRRFTQGLAAVGGMLLTTRRAHAVDLHDAPVPQSAH